jgi:hypothetical protein
MLFVELLEREDWTVFSQIRAKDHDTLPAVLTGGMSGICWPRKRGISR